jgi:hypothetical protein
MIGGCSSSDLNIYVNFQLRLSFIIQSMDMLLFFQLFHVL